MSDIGKKQPKEYSDRFDELRQNRVANSYYKYGAYFRATDSGESAGVAGTFESITNV